MLALFVICDALSPSDESNLTSTLSMKDKISAEGAATNVLRCGIKGANLGIEFDFRNSTLSKVLQTSVDAMVDSEGNMQDTKKYCRMHTSESGFTWFGCIREVTSSLTMPRITPVDLYDC